MGAVVPLATQKQVPVPFDGEKAQSVPVAGPITGTEYVARGLDRCRLIM
jgi:hypothetical protein